MRLASVAKRAFICLVLGVILLCSLAAAYEKHSPILIKENELMKNIKKAI
ncbi:MAG: hypothetical protein KJ574_00635 [Nanoarchaeota archaeon]|nr:hypothetical protein [Nanoarchaeota archaeon]